MKRILISAVVVCVTGCLITAAVLYAGSKERQDQPSKNNLKDVPLVYDDSARRPATSNQRNLIAEAEPEVGAAEAARPQIAIGRPAVEAEDTATSSSPAPITIRAAKKASRRNEIKQMYRQLENKMERMEQLEFTGKKDAIKEVQQEINNLKEEIADLEEQQGDDADGPPRGNDFPRDFPPGVEPGFGGEPDMPPMQEPGHRGPRNELQNRIEHMMQAARHLEEAGMHDRARDLQEEAEEMAGEQGGNHDLRKLLRLVHELKSEMKGLRREVRELRKGMEPPRDLDFDEGDFRGGPTRAPLGGPTPVDGGGDSPFGGVPNRSDPTKYKKLPTSGVPPVRGGVRVSPLERDDPFEGSAPANPKAPTRKVPSKKMLKKLINSGEDF